MLWITSFSIHSSHQCQPIRFNRNYVGPRMRFEMDIPTLGMILKTSITFLPRLWLEEIEDLHAAYRVEYYSSIRCHQCQKRHHWIHLQKHKTLTIAKNTLCKSSLRNQYVCNIVFVSKCRWIFDDFHPFLLINSLYCELIPSQEVGLDDFIVTTTVITFEDHSEGTWFNYGIFFQCPWPTSIFRHHNVN